MNYELRIYNSLSGEKEKLIKSKKRPLRLFVCGPTVYDYSHLGHARTYLFFDIFVRYLRSQKIKTFYLQNITDIDDKIIARAKEQRKNPLALAKFFEREYRRDMRSLDINTVNKYARASDFIKPIVKQVQTLLKKGYAYKIDGDGYYFDISKFKEYGKLSKRTVQQAEDATSRIDESVKKRNRGDFCLWKSEEKPTKVNDANKKFKIIDGEPLWYTPLGWGRPGWHIEDTAITETFFGPQYDIHGGAVELKFPHHEAEIAQQEAASGKKPFVKIWMHTGILTINGKKMAKSLKNFITIRDFVKKHSPEILRWLILNIHYRSPVDFSEKIIQQAENSFKTVQEFLEKLEFIQSQYNNRNQFPAVASISKTRSLQLLKNKEKEFYGTLNDDFNTPAAIAAIFNLIKELNPRIWTLSKNEAISIKKFILSNLKAFGLAITTPKIPRKIKKIAGQRELFRINKQFIQADILRNQLKRLGYQIEDTPLGPFIQKSV